MSKAIQRRRGTTAEHADFTGLVGELTVDTTKNTVVVHDGVTAGGHPLAKENHNHDTTYASKAHESSTSAHPEMTATDAEVDAGIGSKWVKVSQLIRATVKTISSILPITLGGTGASTPEGARTNLGLGSVATENIVPVAKGGTGATTASAARANLGLGDAAVKTVAVTPAGADDSGKLPALDATGKLPSGFIPTVEVSYVPEAGHATNADYATTAGSADTATSATTADSATNADKVDGYHASKTPNPNTVPVADAAGKLSVDWLPPMEASSLNGYTASQTPGASKIPVADAYGQLDAGWFPTLNADTLDGYHAQLTPAANRIPVTGSDGKLAEGWLPSRLGGTCTLITDWNAATENGWYMGQGAANGPYAEWLMGEVIKHNDLWICQRVCRFTADQEWYVRYKIDGAWQPWRHLVTASDTGHSNLGSFCWAINLSPTTVAPGGLISGSELKPAGITSGSGLRVYSYALIGTWRCLGYALGKTDVNLYATLWQRIA
jgi:hypothetical protein